MPNANSMTALATYGTSSSQAKLDIKNMRYI